MFGKQPLARTKPLRKAGEEHGRYFALASLGLYDLGNGDEACASGASARRCCARQGLAPADLALVFNHLQTDYSIISSV